LLSEASNRFDQILNFDFTPTNAQARGDKLILVTGIATDQSGQIPDTKIIWRLSAQKGKPIKIIDLEIENISMLKTQQDENTALIKRSGGDFSALIDAMRVRLENVNSQTAN
jgi:phospholipid transport system substrate-binding protein